MTRISNRESLILARLKALVSDACSAPWFKHYTWYEEHHMRIVEKIARDLLPHYPDANGFDVQCLVWFHDYLKIVQDSPRRSRDPETDLLLDAGLTANHARNLIDLRSAADLHTILDIETMPIEAMILASADGCAHLVGPFLFTWWMENGDRGVDQLVRDNLAKMTRDWGRKVVLPEARVAYEGRYLTLVAVLQGQTAAMER